MRDGITVYLDPFDPRDDADFESVEDRSDLADISFEPCSYCGGSVRVLGAFGTDIVSECGSCGIRLRIEWNADEDDVVLDDEEGEWS